jgi:protoheme IX farnesyltransferase
MQYITEVHQVFYDRIRRVSRPFLFAGVLIVLTFVGAIWALSRADASGPMVGALALASLGIALATLVRVHLPDAPRIGARAAAARRRHTIVNGIAVILLYGAIVAGMQSVAAGGLWACQSWPWCVPGDGAAIVTLLHRGAAALATLIAAVSAWQLWRTQQSRLLRVGAGSAVGLILGGHLLGAGMALGLTSTAWRIGHLAVGIAGWGALVVLTAVLTRAPYHWQRSDTDERGASDRVLLSGRPSLLKDYISLTKPGVISLLIFTTITSMYITPAGVPELGLVLWTALGGWLMAAGSHALNCYFDRDVDVQMGRTSRRPIPSGRIPAWHAAVLGVVLGVIATAVLLSFVNWVAAALALAGLFYYVVIYTIALKRHSTQNIVIGGGAGAFPPLVGWAAVTGDVAPAALLLWVIIFYWTPPHFWALALIRQVDYARAGIPMLPVIVGDAETKRQIVLYSIMMVALTLLPLAFGMLGLSYTIAAALLGAIFIGYAVRLMHATAPQAPWGLYKYSLLYLALLFAAMVVDRVAFA